MPFGFGIIAKHFERCSIKFCLFQECLWVKLKGNYILQVVFSIGSILSLPALKYQFLNADSIMMKICKVDIDNFIILKP